MLRESLTILSSDGDIAVRCGMPVSAVNLSAGGVMLPKLSKTLHRSRGACASSIALSLARCAVPDTTHTWSRRGARAIILQALQPVIVIRWERQPDPYLSYFDESAMSTDSEKNTCSTHRDTPQKLAVTRPDRGRGYYDYTSMKLWTCRRPLSLHMRCGHR